MSWWCPSRFSMCLQRGNYFNTVRPPLASGEGVEGLVGDGGHDAYFFCVRQWSHVHEEESMLHTRETAAVLSLLYYIIAARRGEEERFTSTRVQRCSEETNWLRGKEPKDIITRPQYQK